MKIKNLLLISTFMIFCGNSFSAVAMNHNNPNQNYLTMNHNNPNQNYLSNFKKAASASFLGAFISHKLLSYGYKLTGITCYQVILFTPSIYILKQNTWRTVAIRHEHLSSENVHMPRITVEKANPPGFMLKCFANSMTGSLIGLCIGGIAHKIITTKNLKKAISFFSKKIKTK